MDEHRNALSWTDADAALKRKQKLAPALVEQLERAKAASDRAEEHLSAREASTRDALQALQRADGAVASLDEVLARDREDLAQTGVEDPSAEALARAKQEASALEQRRIALLAPNRKLSEELARSEERLRSASKEEQEARRQAEEEERSFRPAEERWERLRALSEARGVLASALAS